jgi:hypothetical protein
MQYKTIALELLKDRTELYERLRLTYQLLPMLEMLAKELKASQSKGLPRRSQPDTIPCPDTLQPARERLPSRRKPRRTPRLPMVRRHH